MIDDISNRVPIQPPPGRLDVKFEVPEAFLQVHSTELLLWAGDLQRWGPMLKVCLLRAPVPPDVPCSLLPADVTLECMLLKREASGDRMFLIQPHTPWDAEMIRMYVDKLPVILKAREKARAELRARGGKVDAVFDKIPQEFVSAYAAELRRWGNGFGALGPHRAVVLRRVPGQEVKLDEYGQEPMVGVSLEAEVEHVAAGHIRLIIRPETDQDERLIARHCEDIRRYGEPQERRAN